MQSPAELGHSVTADRILFVDPENPVLVGIERHRLAVTLQIGAGRRKIVEGALALDKLQMHQPAGGIVNVDEQGAARPATLEPPMLRRVDPSIDLPRSSIGAPSRAPGECHEAPQASLPPVSGRSPGNAPG